MRSDSVDSYLLGTRILAALATLALVAGIASDLVDGTFWQKHALLAALSANVVLVMLTVGVFNEAVERRRQRRWSVLAQYAMLDLVRGARMTWTGLLEWSSLLPSELLPEALAEEGAHIVRDRARVTTAFTATLSALGRRQALHDALAAVVVHSNEMLGRWAGVMLNADIYAGIIDRHVELASNIMWLSSILDSSTPPGDAKRHRLARSSPAVQIEGQISDGLLIERLVVIARLAEELDRSTLEIALRIVPADWWRGRLGPGAPSDLRVPSPRVSALPTEP